MRARHYFDHAASSPLSQVCLDAFARYDSADWAGANPNSLHTSGRAAFAALEEARSVLARALGARRPSEVIFTGGGTEANTLAVRGLSQAVLRDASKTKRRRVLMSSIEHDSILEPVSLLEHEEFSVEQIPVLANGELDLDTFESMLGDDVALVCVMAANNEVGTVQPLKRVVELAHSCGALVHTDAIQAFGHIPFNVSQLGVDTASVAAHKVAGPVSCGALYLRSRTALVPQQVGGGQEGGMRSGTCDVRNAMAFAAVADQASRDVLANAEVLRAHGREFLATLESLGANFVVTVEREGAASRETLPNLVHLLIPGHQTEGLLLALDDLGFEASGGSACSSGSLNPSHVLNAMGVPRDLAFCALRLSYDIRTAPREFSDLAHALAQVCSASPRRRR